MTTPRIPTPADLAARVRPPSVRRKGEPAPSRPFRERFEWAVTHSNLTSMARHVALTVATYADYQTGVIPPGRPGVPTLATAAGMGHIPVRRYLHELEERGFVQRVGEPGGGHAVAVTLLIPPDPRR